MESTSPGDVPTLQNLYLSNACPLILRDTINIKTYFFETDYVCSMIDKIRDLSPDFIGAMSKNAIYYYKDQLITTQGHLLLNFPKPKDDDTSSIDTLTIGSESFEKTSGVLNITPIEKVIEKNICCSYAINRSTLYHGWANCYSANTAHSSTGQSKIKLGITL